jgi:SH3-like domain-containing protein
MDAALMARIGFGKGRCVGPSGGIMRVALGIALAVHVSSPASAQQKPPYWASIAAGEARMRTGPGRQFPVSWEYRRVGLPVRVVATYPNWRKVRDPDGDEGWMQANLLSDQRTGMIRGPDIKLLRDAPADSGKIIWRAEPGVIGKISECGRGWCRIDIGGRIGYVPAAHLWGTDLREVEP